MPDKFWWYTARSTGLVAWALVVASSVWGLLLATRLLAGRATSASLLTMHRFLGALALCFTGAHVVAIVADSFVQFGWADTLVPFVSEWRPAAVGLGIVAMYLLIVVEATSLVRQRLSPRAWRGIHLTSYVAFALASVHLLTAGTDARDLVPRAIAVAVAMLVVFSGALLLTWRTAPRLRDTDPSH